MECVCVCVRERGLVLLPLSQCTHPACLKALPCGAAGTSLSGKPRMRMVFTQSDTETVFTHNSHILQKQPLFFFCMFLIEKLETKLVDVG